MRNGEATWRVVDAVAEVADRHGRTWPWRGCSPDPAWLLTRPGVASVLLGARTTDQLDEVLGAASLELGADDVDLLTGASAPGLPEYPYGMLEEFSDLSVWRELGTATDGGLA